MTQVTQTRTLTDFLLARIAEDERAARAASHQKVAGPFHGHWRSDSALLSANGALEASDRTHIARHDPARVLAECEAKRQLLSDETLTYGVRANGESSAFHLRVMGYLALPYADHPDYREEWRP
jgi:Family of unknown function (DUF6221)